ncbi:uridine diphosphate-N-acetylglucosamine-binding protein YvcK [Patescibacteria group bacterium]
MRKDRPNIVVIGGGTGTSVVLSGLKKHNVNLTAIVSVADSGGSTGRLRDEFGFLPVGDLRQSLAALARENDQSWIRKLLLYRFNQGDGLKGHNLGNLILTALQDMTGSTPESLEISEKIFNLEGKIIPITNRVVDLVVEYEDGTIIIGEHHLNPEKAGGKKIKRIKLSPRAKIYPKAQKAILNADLIIIGPGDLYASILSNLAVEGVKGVFKKTKAKIAFIVNLMTRYTQTHEYKSSDHVKELKKYMGKHPDYVIINTEKIPSRELDNYKSQNEYPVEVDVSSCSDFQVIKDDLTLVTKAKQRKSDEIKRSLLRHDEKRLTKILLKILK